MVLYKAKYAKATDGSSCLWRPSTIASNRRIPMDIALGNLPRYSPPCWHM